MGQKSAYKQYFKKQKTRYQKLGTQRTTRIEKMQKLISEAHDAIKSKNWQRLLVKAKLIIAHESNKNRPLGYKLACTACRRLGNVAGMERYLRMAIKQGVTTINLATELLAYFYRIKNYSELEEFYEKVIDNPRLPFEGHTIMIKYYGGKGEFDIAEEVYNTAMQQISVNNPALRPELNKIYILYVLGKKPDPKELSDFILNLRAAGQFTKEVFNGYLGVLYDKRAWPLLIEEYKKEEKYRTNETILIYLNALRKLGQYKQAIEEAITFAKNLRDGEPAKNDALATQGFCLIGLGKKEEAKALFQNILWNINPSDPHYLWVICGYLFTEPKLNLAEKRRFEQILTQKLKTMEDTKLTKDMENALKILKTL